MGWGGAAERRSTEPENSSMAIRIAARIRSGTGQAPCYDPSVDNGRGTTMPLPDFPAFTRFLGVNVLHRSPERTEAELTVREELCNRRGVLHGGAVMALGDTLGGMTASISLPDGGRTATIESKTNFFAAVPKGDTAHAVCMPLHRGRTTIVLETRITRGDGKLAAIVTQTQLIFDTME
jgi:1,4-dihydroxy-2-naphthoyl-CoA hydrolase